LDHTVPGGGWALLGVGEGPFDAESLDSKRTAPRRLPPEGRVVRGGHLLPGNHEGVSVIACVLPLTVSVSVKA